MQNSVLKIDQFFDEASSLRKEFLEAFANPLETREERFRWDYWHVPNQYTLHRTLASQFFSSHLYEQFEESLAAWGQENLGCSEISTPWISYYVDGCEQRLHADNPHGPWAFVFSLTDWSERKFTGGETQILSELTLDYWNQTEFRKGVESPQLFDLVEPEFNRLTVFDPRKPHGVSRVGGTLDPREGRVVIHGWFLDPQPYVSGGLAETDIGSELGAVLNPALDQIESDGAYDGYLSFEVKIAPSGEVESVRCVVETLRSVDPNSESVKSVESQLSKALYSSKFPSAVTASELRLPVVFR